MTSFASQVYPDSHALAYAAADEVYRLAKEAVAARGIFTLALAGGSTPKKLYSLLATEPRYTDFPWEQTEFFYGDERHVPPTHSDSNYHMTEQTLFSTGRVPLAHIHRVPSEFPIASEGADLYEKDLRSFFKNESQLLHGFPRFDLILLGMGADGHTASLFPGTTGLHETERWVISNWVEKLSTHRITFSYPVINHAAHIYLCVAGLDKADRIQEVLETRTNELAYPVQALKPVQGKLVWLLDQAAASKLTALPTA